jgi:hypothetical protein
VVPHNLIIASYVQNTVFAEDVVYDQESEFASYSGQVLNGQKHGYGILKWKSGQMYMGQFKSDKRSGLGKLADVQGKLIYEGSFDNDVFSGSGILTSEDGSVYKGDFAVGLKEGMGVQTWPNGEKYVGEWHQNKKNGFGTVFFAKSDSINRLYYTGNFINDEKNGNGFFEWKDGAFYKGGFKNGIRHDIGLEFFSNGEIFNGTYVNDERQNGANFFGTSTNGLVYLGPFENGKIAGSGTYYWRTRAMYEGPFRNGGLNGQGTYYYPDGEKYNGEWKDGLKHGIGTLYAADGTVKYNGQWKNGHRQNCCG